MKTIFFLILLQFVLKAEAQVIDSSKRLIPVDSLAKKSTAITNKSKVDSILKNHSPKKAAIRSAIFPGLGQIYNKKYWKLPIVYGAIGTTAVVFFFNLSTYKDLRFAYKAKIEAQPVNFPYAKPDSTDYRNIKPELVNISVNSLRSYRNEYRKNIDYSVLVFILLWGLNVADAAVDAHLKTFDVTPDLTFHFNFGHSQMAGTTGVSLVLAFK
ncbi:MAG TPA: DUF5683 domain-containing protein [Flavisolibacter sp.]|nr:DUF5683 domain-containing protein [Flavisolibacter sp.]